MKFIKVCKWSNCWLWQGYICKRMYPRFYIQGRSCALAHRASYALFNGPINRNKVIHHKCNNTKCVNPEHLEQLTQSENMKAMHTNKVQPH